MESVDEIIKQIDFEGHIFEVAIVKEYEQFSFIIDVEANKTIPYHLNLNKIKFTNDFIIKRFHLING